MPAHAFNVIGQLPHERPPASLVRASAGQQGGRAGSRGEALGGARMSPLALGEGLKPAPGGRPWRA